MANLDPIKIVLPNVEILCAKICDGPTNPPFTCSQFATLDISNTSFIVGLIDLNGNNLLSQNYAYPAELSGFEAELQNIMGVDATIDVNLVGTNLTILITNGGVLLEEVRGVSSLPPNLFYTFYSASAKTTGVASYANLGSNEAVTAVRRNSCFSSGINILPQEYSITTGGMFDLRNYLNNYLAANDFGGSASITFDANFKEIVVTLSRVSNYTNLQGVRVTGFSGLSNSSSHVCLSSAGGVQSYKRRFNIANLDQIAAIRLGGTVVPLSGSYTAADLHSPTFKLDLRSAIASITGGNGPDIGSSQISSNTIWFSIENYIPNTSTYVENIGTPQFEFTQKTNTIKTPFERVNC